MSNRPTQYGDTVAFDPGAAANLLGAPLAARRDEPETSDASDLSNVVPFARPRRGGPSHQLVLPTMTPQDRAAVFAAVPLWQRLAFIAGSLTLHAGLLAAA